MYLIVLLVLFIATLLVLCLHRKKLVDGFANFFGEDNNGQFPQSLYERDKQLDALQQHLNEYVSKGETLDVDTTQINANTVNVKQNVNIVGQADFQGGIDVEGKTSINGGELPRDIKFIGGDLHDSGISISKAGDLRIFAEDLPENDLGVYFKTLDGTFTNTFVAKKNGDRFLIKVNEELSVDNMRIADKYTFSDMDNWLRIEGGKLSTGDLTTTDVSVGNNMQTNELTSAGPLNVAGDLVAQKITLGNAICIDDVCLTKEDWEHLRVPRTGPTGPQGVAGDKGESGKIGMKGPIGERGPSGPPGPKGARGKRGVVGVDGLMGPTGDKGEQGPRGMDGPKGNPGPQGPEGDPGDKAISIKAIKYAQENRKVNIETTAGQNISLDAESLIGKTIKEISVNNNAIMFKFTDNTTQSMKIPQVILTPAPVFYGEKGGSGDQGSQGIKGPDGDRGNDGPQGKNVDRVFPQQQGKLAIVEDGVQRDVAFPSPLQPKYATRTEVDSNNNLYVVWVNGEKQLIANFPRA
jgi:hypothetical protein